MSNTKYVNIIKVASDFKSMYRQQPLISMCVSCVCVCVAAVAVGIVVVRGDCDLETCRLYIDRLQEVRTHTDT